MTPYPPLGFHFRVTFELSPQVADDTRFQEVSGFEVEMEMESYTEGGQNRFTWQVPKRARYSDITLKRGLLVGSKLIGWCRDGLENFTFAPINVTIALLNEKHEPVMSWYVVSAIPKKWSVSSFNAEDNAIVVESITLSYRYFNIVNR
ncbi:phage tail protein [Chryseolinea lacunae]|uniref:Phage tail protein n=1 Tax=Chryseolinea lacunae TaxID=2801331 RepID=A0ABS1KPI3_9BACT|nr:phage tail protein [Chryseolinea lacunae]MBL0741133.1 phage tail protein [Chryseolinea lacunae]